MARPATKGPATVGPDTLGELDGKTVRLADVPAERRAEWIYTDENGERFRPFRFIGTQGRINDDGSTSIG